MTLTGKTGKELHTFAVFLDKKGKPDPSLGVVLSLDYGNDPYIIFLEKKQ